VLFGAIPLLPILAASSAPDISILFSALLAGLIFFGIGFFKGNIFYQQPILSGVKTLLTGGLAAFLAFGAGHWLTNLLSLNTAGTPQKYDSNMKPFKRYTGK